MENTMRFIRAIWYCKCEVSISFEPRRQRYQSTRRKSLLPTWMRWKWVVGQT